MRPSRAILLLHATVVVFGFTGVLGKLIVLPAVPLVFWRTLIGALGLHIWMLIRRRGRGIPSDLTLPVAGTGVLVALHWVTFFAAIKASTVSLALAVMATAPFFVALIEPVIRCRKLDPSELLLGLVALFGLWWMYRVDVSYGWGMVLALISSFCAALFGTLNSVWSQRAASLSVSRLELAVASLVLGIVLLATGEWSSSWPGPSDWGWLLLLGLIATSMAFAITVEVMRVLSPFTVAMAINLEPVYAILLALVVFGQEEVMPSGFYGGACVLILSVFLDVFLKRRRARAAVEEVTP
jgi:drug/metabolite transporter (DMT)-like permease